MTSQAEAAAERWFFALWPDAQARESLAAGCSGLICEGARFAHPADLHLTLRYLGPLTPSALAGAERAATSLGGPPVPLCIDRVGHFHRSQVLWAGPASPSSELLALADGLEQALVAEGLDAETRPFRTHITIARRVIRLPALKWPGPVCWTAAELVLAAGCEGQVPRYQVRYRWPLT